MPDSLGAPLDIPGLDGSGLAGTRAALIAVSGSLEADFLDAGERLESAIGVLGALSGRFDTLLGELQSDALRAATADLSQAARRVSALAGTRHGEQEALAQVGRRASAIEGRVPPMRKAVKAVEVLAINARIAAAGIGSAGADFQSFLSELVRPLTVAQSTLERFSSELAALGARVRGACADRAQFERQQSSAIESIPRRLSSGVEAIAAHGARAAAAAAAIGRRSQQVRARVGQAVSALQIGDTTRQRIEHVVEALARLDRGMVAPTVLRLMRAQLEDAAAELEREAERTVAALTELGSDAQEIVRLGQGAAGGTAAGGASFLAELQDQVGKAGALLGGFDAARLEAARVVDSVSDAVERLGGHISTISSLEADLRVMGLNTTLKCARLGALGRPLSVIAQELRVYANETAAEASAVMAELEAVRGLADGLRARAAVGGDAEIAGVGEVMAGSLARLEAAERSLAEALAALARDSAAVAGLLIETAARFALDRGPVPALRAAAARLGAAGDIDGTAAVIGEAEAALLETIARSYTMERERAVHARALPGVTPIGPTAAPVASAASIDDLLF